MKYKRIDDKKDVKQQTCRLKNCTFVKTMLMILVVVYHSCVFWTKLWFTNENVIFQSDGLAIFSRWLNSFHISCFTLVSGYLFCYLKYEKDKYQKFLPFVFNKGKRLIIPYLFVALIWVIPLSLITKAIDKK